MPNEIKMRFSLPKEENKFKDIMKHIEGCNIISSEMSGDTEGPEIEEIYECPCGNIVLKQKSVIADVNNPTKGSVEAIHMKSTECTLQ